MARRRRVTMITQKRRARIEAAVDRLLDLLDAIDGDPDEEPSLGAPENHPRPSWQSSALEDQSHWAGGNTKDLEDEHDGCEPEYC